MYHTQFLPFGGAPVFSRLLERITPARVIILGFLLIILTGALLLSLPWASRAGEWTPFLDALFTATSATCVTGLVVYDTVQYWSIFGQLIILILIQIGGMGVVTVAVAISMLSGRKIGLKQRWIMQESISAPQVGGILKMTNRILRGTICIEWLGALLLAIRFVPKLGFPQGLWYSVFHSISAFCNAGFDLQGGSGAFSSLTGYAPDPLVNLVIISLVVVGGIGFLTWDDVTQYKWHFRSYRLQTKLVLATTALLLALPALFFFCYEFSRPVWEGMPLGKRILASLFQSMTTRTAGFNTVDLTQFSESSLLIMILLMLVGGSPGSTAGGFKVTTLAVLVLSAVSVFRQKSSTQAFGRRLAPEVLRNAVTIFVLYLALFLSSGILISCVDNVPLLSALFETGSAIATVGLTLGLTPGLSALSHLVLIFLMYCGRVGGLTLIFAVVNTDRTPAQLPQERVTVG